MRALPVLAGVITCLVTACGSSDGSRRGDLYVGDAGAGGAASGSGGRSAAGGSANGSGGRGAGGAGAGTGGTGGSSTGGSASPGGASGAGGDGAAGAPGAGGGDAGAAGDASLDGSASDASPDGPSVPVGDASADADSGPLATGACPDAADATVTARLRVTADDYVSIWFNGELVAVTTSLWMTVKEYDVDVFLYPGRANVVALEARNAFEQNGLDRGLIFELRYQIGAVTRYVNSDATWRWSPPGDGGADWIALDHPDADWDPVEVLGPAGMSPWTSAAFNGEAQWLWSFVSTGTAAEKPDNDTIRLRKTFFMDAEGEVSGTPRGCR